MPSSVNLRALGLNTQPNQIDLPDGSLTIASNIHIRRDNVIESRRGFKLFGNTFGTTTDRAKQLFEYKERIIRHYDTTLEFDSTGEGVFTAFAGSFTEAVIGRRMRTNQTNGNIYFTTSEGIKKISATTASELTSDSGFIARAGGVKAVDLTARIKSSITAQTGFLPVDSTVAYRIVWGINDANSNLILGTPSERVELFNDFNEINKSDFMKILSALDSLGAGGSIISDADYIDTLGVTTSTSASDLRLAMIDLAEKLDEDILYGNEAGTEPLTIASAAIASGICTVTFSAGDPSTFFSAGSEIFLDGFSPATGTLDGGQTVTTADATTLTFNTDATGAVALSGTASIVSNEYRSITEPVTVSTNPTHDQLQSQQDFLSNVINQLGLEPTTVISSSLSTDFIEPLDVVTTSAVELEITIPDDVTTDHFYQIYRSATLTATGTTVLANLTASDELQLVFEAFPTTTEITAGQVIAEDITPDEFRGTFLYTNSSSGEGILQANDIPPFATDIQQFKGHTFYSNTKTKHRENLSLLGVSKLIEDFNAGTTPSLLIAKDGIDHKYSFILGAVQVVDITTVAGGSLASSGTASHFFINSPNNKEKFTVFYKIGTATDPAISGRTSIEIVADAGDTSAEIAERTKNKLSELSQFYSTSIAGSIVTVTNNAEGVTDTPTAETSGFTIAVTTTGTGEKVAQQQDTFTCVADVAGSLAGLHFLLNSTFTKQEYYVWFKVSGVGADPALAGKIGIQVDLTIGDSAATVASTIESVLDTSFSSIWTASSSTADLTIQNVQFGPTTAPTVATSTFTLTNDETGALDVLLSNVTSTAQAVDQTARSLVRVINKNDSEEVYAFYLSGVRDVPGQMLIEARDLSDEKFYSVGNNENTGSSFNPAVSPTNTISSISTGDSTTMLITTASAHGLINQQQVLLTNTDSTPSVDGIHEITFVSDTTFRINKTINVAGTEGSMVALSSAETSENEDNSHRLYFSKFQQPEAVPIVNFIDIGATDKAILRIFPLRDSLFVFKEDGLFRISGETTPFTVGLFDSSTILTAPDSLDVSNNLLFGWTTQGISTISESGTSVISRPIDVDILSINNDKFPNFESATFGVGYEFEQAYLVWTTKKVSDTVGTIAYRYSALTNTWTTYDKTNTCGFVNPADDRLYLGAGDINSLEQERKNFDRTDYADREITKQIRSNSVLTSSNQIQLADVSDLTEGDVLVQTQDLTIYEFNMLLKRLDNDPGVTDTDYVSTLQAVAGDNLRTKILALATKLDSDAGVTDTDYADLIAAKTGSITAISIANPTNITSVSHELVSGRIVSLTGTDSTPTIDEDFEVTVADSDNFSAPTVVISPGTTGTFTTQNNDFQDIKACYNSLISKINSDSGITFQNYDEVDTQSDFEVVITAVDNNTNQITINNDLEFIVGPSTVYKSIKSEVVYAPTTMDNPLYLKHFREATIMFENKAFTNATLSFSTDLLPAFTDVEFNMDGSGIFGHTNGFGTGFFGGASHAAPFRTYVPRNSQRCRFMSTKFTHEVAREKYSIFGITLTGEITSTRAYR